MDIHRATLSSCGMATGLVVAIDVLRAFTTAAYIFNSGVKEIILMSGVQEALDLKREMPDCLLLGEVDGLKAEGFDLGNSPSMVLDADLSGKRIIQRTTAGTQGVVLAKNADTILAAALTNVSATARYIARLSPERVTLVQTGYRPGGNHGDEDVACADAIESLLLGKSIDWTRIKQRVRASPSARHYDGTQPDFPPQDLEIAIKYDLFNFAMEVERKDNLHIMHCVHGDDW